MSRPLVTVVIPAYNVAPFLERCLDSCLGQSLREVEIVVVNDGSTDRTRELLEEYTQRDERVHAVHTENRGVVAARSRGVAEARGLYLCFVDGDDCLPAGALSALYKEAVRTGADLISGSFIRIYPDGERHERLLSGRGKIAKPDFVTALLQTSSFYLWGRLYRKDCFEATLWDLPSPMILGEDMAILSRLVDRAETVAVIAAPVYVYYYRPESASAGKETRSKAVSLYEASLFAEKLLKPYCIEKEGKMALACFIADHVYKYFLSNSPFHLYGNDIRRRLAGYWMPGVKECVGMRNRKCRFLLDIASKYPSLAVGICKLYRHRRYERR